MNNLRKDLLASVSHRAFWAYAVWLDVLTKYRRTRLGLIWLVMPPATYILGLGFLYSLIMGRDPWYFIPHLGMGYVLWRLAINSLTEAADVYSGHQAFIMDGRIRLTDYILRILAKNTLYFLVGLLVLVGVFMVDPHISLLGVATLALSVPLYMANVLWMAVLVSLIGARFRDTREFMGTGLIFGFLLTPIIWDAASVPPDSIRGTVVRFNPFFHLIELVRSPILGVPPEGNTFVVVAVMTVLGWAVAAMVYRRYARFVPIWL